MDPRELLGHLERKTVGWRLDDPAADRLSAHELHHECFAPVSSPR